MKNKKMIYLVLATAFIVIGCIGTFASDPGIYTAVFALGIVFLLLGSAEKSKK